MKSKNGLYEAYVCISGRRPVHEARHNSQTYIEGRAGSEYTLRFINHSGAPVLVLPSVDGLSVCDGKPAGLESPGYVVGANSSVDIPGWKVDSATAAKFVFARRGSTNSNPSKRTYAELQGADTANIGSIGFAVFAKKIKRVEKPKPEKEYVPYPYPVPYPSYPTPIYPKPYYPPYTPYQCGSICDSYTLTNSNGIAGANSMDGAMGDLRSTLGAAQSRTTLSVNAGLSSVGTETLQARSVKSVEPEPAMGTGFGRATSFSTTSVEFERAHPKQPDAVLSLVYDSLLNLEAAGVDVEDLRYKKKPRPAVVAGRNPFPASPELSPPSCAIPEGWNKSKRR